MAASWILHYSVKFDGTMLLEREAAFSKNGSVTTRPPGSMNRSQWSGNWYRSHFDANWDPTPTGAIEKFIRRERAAAEAARAKAETHDDHVRAAEALWTAQMEQA
jgi:hypothetical protein